MATSRIYIVKAKGSEDDPIETSLVRAQNRSAALRHVAEECFTVGVATQDELVSLVQKGVAVETAGGDDNNQSED